MPQAFVIAYSIAIIIIVVIGIVLYNKSRKNDDNIRKYGTSKPRYEDTKDYPVGYSAKCDKCGAVWDTKTFTKDALGRCSKCPDHNPGLSGGVIVMRTNPDNE